MQQDHPVREVVDLTDPSRNILFGASVEEARARVARGDAEAVRAIDGAFAILAREGHLVRMARSLSVPMRYFIAKRAEGPALVGAHRIDDIAAWLAKEELADQFHPTYTRMVPAHYITEIALVGCPDPNPTYTRFFAPQHESLPADLDIIGEAYVAALANAVEKWLTTIPEAEPIGVSFSGGIDSGTVFVVVYHLLRKLGMNPGRLKAFTLSVDGGDDLAQARRFLGELDLQMFLEPIEVDASTVDLNETVRVVEDYKPLDVQAAAMVLALCRGVRARYPSWRYLVDGDGGDENLKDYPIEENPELTIRSVLNNRMLYQEGWGVESIKHSLVYSGGLSRSCTRTFAPARREGFDTFSPFHLPSVIEVAEGIPFVEMTDWRHDALYELKGDICARGVKALTGLTLPVFPKRRFQHGAMKKRSLGQQLPDEPQIYRRAFERVFAG